MDQPVGCCHRHCFIHEDTAPRDERMVAGDNQTAALIAMGYQLEQHARFSVVAFDIPQVIYHFHPVAIQFQQKLVQFQLCPCFTQLLQQLSSTVEPGPATQAYNAIHDRRCQMAYSQATGTEEQEVFSGINPVCRFAELPEMSAIQFRQLPDHLPREINSLEPAETCCPDCGSDMAWLSEVSAEQLELVSSALKVIRTVRVKKACTRCDCIVEASAPSRPIDRGIAGPGLLARVLTAKYCEHLPLYRQCEIFARQGMDLSRALLSNWVDACCRLMAPLDEALYRYVMDCRKLHTDDTPVPVLAPGRKKTKTGRIWTYVRDDRNAGSSDPPAAWFAFSPDRQGKHPQQHLRHYHDVLQADAFAGYDRLFSPERDGGPLTKAACWAHARRKIHDVYISTQTVTAEEALKRIVERKRTAGAVLTKRVIPLAA